MIVVLILAFVISFVLILVLRGNPPDVPFQSGAPAKIHRLGELPEGQDASDFSSQDDSSKNLRSLTRQQLEEFCRRLLDPLGLKVQSIDASGPNAFHLLASCEHLLLRGDIILYGLLLRDATPVSPAEVIGFSDMVKAEKAMKGIFLTNGYFSEEVMKLNEGASIELIDAKSLWQLMQDKTPDLLAEITKSKDEMR